MNVDLFIADCKSKGVRFKLHFWGRVILCGYVNVVRVARTLIKASPELEAALLLRMAEKVPALADAIEERQSIMETDDRIKAALGLCGPWWPEDENDGGGCNP